MLPDITISPLFGTAAARLPQQLSLAGFVIDASELSQPQVNNAIHTLNPIQFLELVVIGGLEPQSVGQVLKRGT